MEDTFYTKFINGYLPYTSSRYIRFTDKKIPSGIKSKLLYLAYNKLFSENGQFLDQELLASHPAEPKVFYEPFAYTALMSLWAAYYGFKTYASDLDPKVISFVKKLARWYNIDSKLTYSLESSVTFTPKEKVDILYLGSSSYYWLKRSEFNEMAKTFYKMLNDDGIVYIYYHNYNNLDPDTQAYHCGDINGVPVYGDFTFKQVEGKMSYERANITIGKKKTQVFPTYPHELIPLHFLIKSLENAGLVLSEIKSIKKPKEINIDQCLLSFKKGKMLS